MDYLLVYQAHRDWNSYFNGSFVAQRSPLRINSISQSWILITKIRFTMCNFSIFRAHSAHRPSAHVSAHRVHRSHPPRIFPETWTMRRARSGPTTSLADEPHEPWPADTSGQELEQAPGSSRSWGRRSRRGWSWRSCWARTATSTSEPWTRTRRTPARSSSNKIEALLQSQWTTSSAKKINQSRPRYYRAAIFFSPTA